MPDQLLSLLDRGLSVREIAAAEGVTEQAIYARLDTLRRRGEFTGTPTAHARAAAQTLAQVREVVLGTAA